MTRALITAIDQYNLYAGVNQDINSQVLNATATNSGTITATATNSVLNVSATATSTNTSQNIASTQHNGIALFLTVGTVSVNSVTLGLNIQAVDPLTGATFPWVRVSVDNASIAANGKYTFQMFPGISATLAANNTWQISNCLPATYNVAASLTITTTASQTGVVSYQIGGSQLW